MSTEGKGVTKSVLIDRLVFAVQLDAMKKDELKEEARKLDCKVSGTKDELVARILASPGKSDK